MTYSRQDASGGAITYSLVAASSVPIDTEVSILKTDTSGNPVNITANGSDRIGCDGPIFSVSAATNTGLVRLTIYEQRTIQTGDKVLVSGVGVCPNGVYTATRISATVIDLQGSTYSGTFTPGTVTQVRNVLPLRAQEDHVTLVSDGVSRWTIKSTNLVLPGRDVLMGYNPDYVGYNTSTSLVRNGDYFFSGRTQRLFIRSLALEDCGDPIDFAFRRSEGVPGAYQGIGDGASLGVWYAQALTTDTKSYEGQNAAWYARARGTQTASSSGGSYHIGTTRIGELQTRDAAEFDENQNVYLGGTRDNKAFKVQQDNKTSYGYVRNGADAQVNFGVDGAGADVNLNLVSKGSGVVDVYTRGGSSLVARFVGLVNTARMLMFTSGTSTTNPTIGAYGGGNVEFTSGITLPKLSDGSAQNDSMYFSTTNGRPSYKNSSGTVIVL